MAQEVALSGGGSLTWQEEGLRVAVEARCPQPGPGLYKVWVEGPEGELLLGTLEPEGPGLVLRRRLTRQTLERGGCWPITGGRVALSTPLAQGQRPKGEKSAGAWRPASQPWRLCDDPVVQGALVGQPGLLERREGDTVWLAAPFRTRHPLPLIPLVCLARVEPVCGSPHLVWAFREGRPLVPEKKGEKSGKIH